MLLFSRIHLMDVMPSLSICLWAIVKWRNIITYGYYYHSLNSASRFIIKLQEKGDPVKGRFTVVRDRSLHTIFL